MAKNKDKSKSVLITIGKNKYNFDKAGVAKFEEYLKKSQDAPPPKPINRPTTLPADFLKGVQTDVNSLSKDLQKIAKSYSKLNALYVNENLTYDDEAWLEKQINRLEKFIEEANEKLYVTNTDGDPHSYT
jgi:hypothetical protein